MTYLELMKLANGYAESKVLLVANDLDVFTAIGNRGRRAASLANSCKTTRSGMDLLLRALTGLGLLRMRAGRYWNTRLGRKFLDRHSPCAVTNLLWLLNHHWADWSRMGKVVRYGATGWAPITKMAGFRQRFALAMHERSHVLASVTIDSFRLPPNAGRFLDIGGGAGSYSVALAQRYARLEGVVVDQSVTIARHLIRKEGLAQRIRVRQGNVLTMPFPSPVDVALMSNLVHDFGKQDNKLLLSRVRQALRPGGKLFIVEFFLNSDRTAPVDAAVFSLLMHAFTGTGRAYAWNEVEAWLRATGFGILRRRLITGNIGTLEAVKLSRRD